MTPSLRGTVAVLSVSALSVGALLASGGAALAASPVTTQSDPARDVRAASGTTATQKGTVDITKVTYRVADERLVITTTVVDLRSSPGNQFVQTEATAGGTTVSLVSEIGQPSVKVFTGSAYYTCKGSHTVTSASRDVVRQSVPLECLDGDRVRLQSSALLAHDDGTTFARDLVRTRSIELR